jgi:predicted phosphodiesterase
MKYAIVSDIHANPAAFEMVLADVKKQKVDKIICLGDVTGYGYNAVEAYELVKKNCDVWLLGNHDAACAGIEADALIRINPNYAFDIDERKELGQERLAEMRELPYTYENEAFACSHGDFTVPYMYGYILDVTDVRLNFNANNHRLMFVGHTHAAKVWKLVADGNVEMSGIGLFTLMDGCRYIVNVGSVGYPRHDFFSSYAIFDDCNGTVDLRRLDFDFPAYIKAFAIRGLSLPAWLDHLNRLDGRLFAKTKKKLSLRRKT